MKVVAVFLLLLFFCSTVQAQWNLGISGNWDGLLNWLGSLLPSLDATISATGTFTVTVSRSISLGGTLTLGGSSSFPTLAIGDGFTFSAESLNFAGGMITIGAGGSLVIRNGFTISAPANGEVTINGMASFGGNGVVSSGKLILTGGAYLNSSVAIHNGAQMSLEGDFTLNERSSISGEGSLMVSGDSNFLLQGSAEISSGLQIGSSLDLQASNQNDFSLQVSGPITIQAGAAGSLSVGSGVVLDLSSDATWASGNVEVEANGRFESSGHISITGNAALSGEWKNTGTVSIAATKALTVTDSTVRGAFDVSGSLVIGGSTSIGSTETGGSATISGSGSVNVHQSTLSVHGQSSIGTTVSFSDSTVLGGDAGGSLDLSGSVTISGQVNVEHEAEVKVSSGSCTASALNLGGSTGRGQLTITGDFNLNNCMPTGVNGTLSFSSQTAREHTVRAGTYTIGVLHASASSTVKASGDVVVQGKLALEGSAKFVAEHAATVQSEIEVTGQATLQVSGGAVTAASATFASTATYSVSVASETAAVLESTGSATLNGNLVVDISAEASAATEITIVKYASHTGAFASVDISAAAGRKRHDDGEWKVYYGDEAATIKKESTTSDFNHITFSSAIIVMILAYFFV